MLKRQVLKLIINALRKSSPSNKKMKWNEKEWTMIKDSSSSFNQLLFWQWLWSRGRVKSTRIKSSQPITAAPLLNSQLASWWVGRSVNLEPSQSSKSSSLSRTVILQFGIWVDRWSRHCACCINGNSDAPFVTVAPCSFVLCVQSDHQSKSLMEIIFLLLFIRRWKLIECWNYNYCDNDWKNK